MKCACDCRNLLNKDATASNFLVGDPVKAKYVDGKWYPASIAETRDEPIYVVDWDDKDSRDRLKVASEIRAKGKLEVGAHVKALYQDGRMYGATISKALHETSYVIDWADHDTKDRVKLLSSLKPAGGLSDPICVVIGSTASRGEKELGRTEFKMNDLNPTFSKNIAIKIIPDEEQKLEFKVYDVDAQKGSEVQRFRHSTGYYPPLCLIF